MQQNADRATPVGVLLCAAELVLQGSATLKCSAFVQGNHRLGRCVAQGSRGGDRQCRPIVPVPWPHGSGHDGGIARVAELVDALDLGSSG